MIRVQRTTLVDRSLPGMEDYQEGLETLLNRLQSVGYPVLHILSVGTETSGPCFVVVYDEVERRTLNA